MTAAAPATSTPGSGSNELQPTKQDWEQSARVGAEEARRKRAIETIVVELKKECQTGNLDSCFAVSRLTHPTAIFPAMSETPLKDEQSKADHIQQLKQLCMGLHRASCSELGYQLGIHKADKPYEAALSGGLRGTLETVYHGVGLTRPSARQLVTSTVNLLEKGVVPIRADLVAADSACNANELHGCIFGALFFWGIGHEEGKFEQGDHATEIQRILLSAFRGRCPRFRTACVEAAEYALGIVGTGESFLKEIRDLCEARNAAACERLAGELKGREAEAMYAQACRFGSAASCEQVARHLLEVGDPKRALGVALSACQSARSIHCLTLFERFGQSRDFTSQATGEKLIEHACSKGYARACYKRFELLFRAGKLEVARQGFGRMCALQGHVKACRWAAQIDWLGGRFDSAESLLRERCIADEINSCVELAGVLSSRGKETEAIAILSSQCQLSEKYKGTLMAGRTPHACRLLQKLERGVVLRRVDEIFMWPLDGSRYVDP